MVARRIECIERALEQVFRRVLHTCEGEPPQLKEVRVTRDDRSYGMRIRARFGVQGHPDAYSEFLLSEREWQHEFRDSTRGAGEMGRSFFYDAGILWSRLYEDHYINRMRQAATRQAIAAGMNGANAYEVHNRLEEIDRLTQHMRANHSDVMGVDTARGPDRTATEIRARQSQYRYDMSDAISYSMEPMRQQIAERSREISASLARQTEEHIMRTLGIDPNAQSNTTGDNDGSTLTIETLRQAARALAQNSQHDDWRAAFLFGILPVDYSGAFRVTPNIEVGTKEAQERGLSLLKENLTPEQLQSYEKNQYFEVTGGESGKRYRIRHGRQMNIEQLDAKGNRESGLCALPVGGLVAGDCMLAQKTALELYESEFLKIANRF